MRRCDLTGKKFGKLIVLGYVGHSKWKCQCECGNIIEAYTSNLKSGRNKSCGCEQFTNPHYKDLLGKKFGRLTPIKYLGSGNWICKCECGKEITTNNLNLSTGHIKSCGCLLEERKTVAKFSDDPRAKILYKRYRTMKERCYRPKARGYSSYGGKGIKVCDEWLNSFENFYNWAINNGFKIIEGEYKDQLQIDRIDSNGNYCPENCRWITGSENSARTSITNIQLEELLKQSTDELVQQYIERKIEINEKLQKEKKQIRSGFFIRKNNYCYLRNNEQNKRFLFKNLKTVGLFLNITPCAINYRMKKKNGLIVENWYLEKITKEEFDELSNNVEVIV